MNATMRWILSHKLIILIIAAVVVGVGSSLILAGLLHNQSSPDSDTRVKTTSVVPKVVCDDATLRQGDQLIAGTNGGDLLSLAQDIEKKANYASDQNCLYIVLNGYIRSGDVAKSNETLQRLTAVYDSSRGFSPLFRPSSPSLSTLRQSVTFLDGSVKKQIEESTRNSDRANSNLDQVDKWLEEERNAN